MIKSTETPAVQLTEGGKDAPKRQVGSMALLGWKHIFHLVGVEVQINQKAAPDDKGE